MIQNMHEEVNFHSFILSTDRLIQTTPKQNVVILYNHADYVFRLFSPLNVETSQ